MTKYRTRLLIAIVLLIIGVLLGLGILLGQLFKNYYLDAFYERLEKESNLVAMHLEDYGGLEGINKDELDRISAQLGVGIIISDRKGSVLYSNQQGENSSRLPADFMPGQKAKKHFLKFKNDKEIHYYRTNLNKGGITEGYLFMSMAASQLKEAYRNMWWLLSLSLGLALAVIVILGMRITRRYAKPIESAANVAMELSRGNYRARTYVEDRMDETGLLSSSINLLARNLEDMSKAQEMQQERLSTLIENIGSGLLLIDSRGFINLINRGYRELFEVEPQDILYRPYYDAIPYREIREMIEDIFITEQKRRKQLVLPMAIERKYFDVSALPIIGTHKVWKGVLVVFHDITELKKLEQMRKDFVANVSHELKTPVTSIKGFAETLLDGAMHDERTLYDFLSIILKESDRIQHLIQDLLELSKLEQQSFRLDISSFNLAGMLSEIVQILRGKADEKNIALTFHSDPENLEMEGDPFRLRQVFINLLTNAISYTPQGGSIHLSAANKGNDIKVNVKDTGIGIDEDEIPRIFERFYRVDRARSRNSGGTGLGLAIVKHIVEAHRGRITVNSNAGEGSEFILEFSKSFPGNPGNDKTN